jgi:thiaminase
MAELTQLDEKLAEVLGLAQAAQQSTKKVASLVEDREVKATLKEMREEAAETERRCKELAASLDGKKTAINKKAKETKTEASEMMSTYLGDDADGLDGLEFLIMAEAGELGHVEIVRQMASKARNKPVKEVADWAFTVQKKHFDQTRKAALKLAKEEDPNEAA